MMYLIYQFVSGVDSNIKYVILYYNNIVYVCAHTVVEVGSYERDVISLPLFCPKLYIPLKLFRQYYHRYIVVFHENSIIKNLLFLR